MLPIRSIAGILALLPAILAVEARAEFSEVSGPAGLFGTQPTWGAQIVDLDGDGDLEIHRTMHFYGAFLFTNLGNLSFSVWEIPSLIVRTGDRHGWLWVDLDGDGLRDVVCSHGGDGGCGCSDDGNELWQGQAAPAGTFSLVAGSGGMTDLVGRGRAFSAADIDGDGDVDLYHAKAPLVASPNSMYRNDGALTFVDVAAASGLDETIGTEGGLFADADDDGDPDLIVGGEEFQRPTTYFRNDGGVFVDATSQAFGSLPVASSLDWGDADGDGDLDLLLTEGRDGVFDWYEDDPAEPWFFSHARFGEDGDDVLTFETPGETVIARPRFNGGWYPDFMFLGSTASHPSQTQFPLDDSLVGAPAFTPGVDRGLYIWREFAGGPFQIHSSAPAGAWGNFHVKLLTQNGLQNVVVSGLEEVVIDPAAPRLWRNDGGTFIEVALPGVTPSANPRSTRFVDFDSDGDLDLHQVNRGTVAAGNEPDVLWRNDGGSYVALTGNDWVPGQSAHLADGAVWGDLDRDGDLDCVLQDASGPVIFTLGAPARLYRNDGPTGSSITVEPRPGPAGDTALGTRVTAHVGGTIVHRRLHANAYRGFQDRTELHLGLGAASAADSIVVEWPGGLRQVLRDVPAGERLVFGPGESPTGIGGEAPAPPRLGRIVPQPARGLQTIRVGEGGVTRVGVYDLTGRRIRDLGDVEGAIGGASVAWDGRDDAGRRVAAGVYFVRGVGADPFRAKAVRLR